MPEGDWPAEEIEYLEEVIQEYSRFAERIGENGLSANLLLYYRDELEETLADLEGRIPLDAYLERTKLVDEYVKRNKGRLVREIGAENYKMQRGERKPPKENWWWYL